MKKIHINLLFVVSFLVISLFTVNLRKPLWAHGDEPNTGISDEAKNRTKKENKNSVDNVKDKRNELRTRTGVKIKQDEIRVKAQDKRADIKGELTEKKEEARTSLQDKRQELKERNLKNREELKQRVEERKEELKTRVEEKREEIKNKVEHKREELKKKLEEIKDEKKRQSVERIDRQLDELNRRLLDHYLNMSNKLSDVLIKIAERADKAEERGVDISATRTAIDKANGAIEAVKVAVENQAGKTYTIQVTTEEGLKTDVGKARQALHGDLASVREVVKAAYEAVRSVATTFAKLPKPTTTPETTTTPAP